MAKVTNKEIAEAFRAARSYIEGSKESYICLALTAARHAGQITIPQSLAARAIIENRLGDRSYVTTWLFDKVPGFRDWYEKSLVIERIKELRLYRLRWLDALIEEFDNK